jgi:hypothetical protein
MTPTLPSPTPPAAPRTSVPVRIARALALAAAAVAVVIFGVWVAGGVVTDDFRIAMGLTAVWFLLTGIAALAAVRTRRSLGVPVLIGYVVAAGATGVYLGYTTLHDRVVDETVATGTPASRMPPAAPAGRADARPPDGGERRPAVNVEEARGRFVSGEHTTTGTAQVIRLRGGARVLTLTGFETSPGPDLRVRLVPGGGTDGGADGAIDVGALKGNRGDQQYELPRDAPRGRATVVIWCRAFSALFGAAELRPA